MKEDPVLYCKDCLSLRILSLDKENDCYCGECGSTDIEESEFDDWEEKYKKEYGYKFLKSKRNGREENKDRQDWSKLWKQ